MEYPEICSRLRILLTDIEEIEEWKDSYLSHYVKILRKKERELLSPKKQRALKSWERVT